MALEPAICEMNPFVFRWYFNSVYPSPGAGYFHSSCPGYFFNRYLSAISLMTSGLDTCRYSISRRRTEATQAFPVACRGLLMSGVHSCIGEDTQGQLLDFDTDYKCPSVYILFSIGGSPPMSRAGICPGHPSCLNATHCTPLDFAKIYVC